MREPVLARHQVAARADSRLPARLYAGGQARGLLARIADQKILGAETRD